MLPPHKIRGQLTGRVNIANMVVLSLIIFISVGVYLFASGHYRTLPAKAAELYTNKVQERFNRPPENELSGWPFL